LASGWSPPDQAALFGSRQLMDDANGPFLLRRLLQHRF
jgi:hypothetical protein